MVNASGGTTSFCVNKASSFSISAFCAELRSRLPSSRLASLIFFRMSRNWLTARLVAEAGLLSSCASPAESFPREANRSRCCSKRVASRIRSDITPTRRVVSSGIFCTSSENSEVGNFKIRPSVTARPVTVNCFILENGSTPVTSPGLPESTTVSPPNSPRH